MRRKEGAGHFGREEDRVINRIARNEAGINTKNLGGEIPHGSVRRQEVYSPKLSHEDWMRQGHAAQPNQLPEEARKKEEHEPLAEKIEIVPEVRQEAAPIEIQRAEPAVIEAEQEANVLPQEERIEKTETESAVQSGGMETQHGISRRLTHTEQADIEVVAHKKSHGPGYESRSRERSKHRRMNVLGRVEVRGHKQSLLENDEEVA